MIPDLRNVPVEVLEKLDYELGRNLELMKLIRAIASKYGTNSQLRLGYKDILDIPKSFSEIGVVVSYDDQNSELVVTVNAV